MPRRGVLVDWEIPQLGPRGWVIPLCGVGRANRELFKFPALPNYRPQRHNKAGGVSWNAAPDQHLSSLVASNCTTRVALRSKIYSRHHPIKGKSRIRPWRVRAKFVYITFVYCFDVIRPAGCWYCCCWHRYCSCQHHFQSTIWRDPATDNTMWYELELSLIVRWILLFYILFYYRIYYIILYWAF